MHLAALFSGSFPSRLEGGWAELHAARFEPGDSQFWQLGGRYFGSIVPPQVQMI